MQSFFSRFKNNLDQNYGGRYIEVILKEVLIENPPIARILFPKIKIEILRDKSNLEIEVESLFKSKRRNHRKADLALKYCGKHIALLEIKCLDHPLEYQIDDYIKYAKDNDLHFTYLTQYYPEKEDVIKITKANQTHLLFSDLLKQMIKCKYDNDPIAKLFRDFLEENFMRYIEKFDKKYENALILLMIKGLYVKHDAGFKRKVSLDNIMAIPNLWNAMFNNVLVLGDRLYNDYNEFFNNRFSVNFGFDPEFKLKALEKSVKVKTLNAESDYMDQRHKIGGDLFVTARGKIKQKSSDDFLYISLGYSFYLDLSKQTLHKYLFNGIYGKGINTDREVKLRNGIPNEENCYKHFISSTSKIIEDELKNNLNMKKSFRKSLSDLNECMKI